VQTTYDAQAKKYLATITSPSYIQANPMAPFVTISLHYFVAKDSSATLRVVVNSPEKDGCVNFAADSIPVSAQSGCGDPLIRNFLNEKSLLSAVNISPNPSHGAEISIAFTNEENIILNAELIDIKGVSVAHFDVASFLKGSHSMKIDVGTVASGSYKLLLNARSEEGHIQEIPCNIILSR
jgi:hypothetical protein